MKKYIVTLQAQKVRVDVSQNGDYLKNGHNELKPSNKVFACKYDEPKKVGEIVYLHDCEEEQFGWDGRISYRYSCVVISCIEQNPVTFDLPDPKPFEDICAESAIEHMEAMCRGKNPLVEGSIEYYQEMQKFPVLERKILEKVVEEFRKEYHEFTPIFKNGELDEILNPDKERETSGLLPHMWKKLDELLLTYLGRN